MGSLCSKAGTHSGGHTVLGDGGTAANSRGQTAGTTSGQAPTVDPRIAAAEAAERRLKSERKRGTNAANPNRGKLAAQLEASKSPSKAPEPRQEERLVWD